MKLVSPLSYPSCPATLGNLFKLLSALDLELALRPKAGGSEKKRPTGEW